MFFVLILAAIQMVFLPGYVLLRLFRVDDGLLKTVSLSLALSVTINFMLVVILTSFQIYQAPVLNGIIVFELVLLGFSFWLQRASTPLPGDLHRLHDLGREIYSRELGIERFLGFAVIALGIGTIFFYLFHSYNELGTILTHGDAVISWDGWAVRWASGQQCLSTNGYPQLVPTNWSISYVLARNPDVKFASKWIMSLFPLCLLLLQADLALRTKKASFFFAAFLLGVTLMSFREDFVSTGYVDVPVGFMGLACMYPLLLPWGDPQSGYFRRNLILGALIALGCVMTKQAGYLVAFVFPLFVYLRLREQNVTAKWKTLLPVCLTFLVPFLAFTIYKYLVNQQFEQTNTQYIWFDKNLHGNRSYWERMLYAVHLYTRDLSNIAIFVFVPLTLGAALFDKFWRWIVLVIVVPMFLVWGFFISYDVRNSFILVPFATCAIALGCSVIASWLPAGRNVRRCALLAFCTLLLGGLLWAQSRKYPSGYIVALQNQYTRQQIGDPDLNKVLYEYKNTKGMSGMVMTNYYWLGHLPTLKEQARSASFMEPVAEIDKTITHVKPRYLLLVNYTELLNDAIKFVDDGCASGRFRLVVPIFKDKALRDVRFVEVMDNKQ